MQPRKLEGLRISAVIPAYNEARNILKVLDPLNKTPSIKEIIVVSDGSTDETVPLAERAGAKVIALPRNLGKTRAVMRGISKAEHPVILLCDADLVDLRTEHVTDMIRTFCEGFDMVIMDKGSQPWVFREFLQSVPAVSGTRVFEKAQFAQVCFREADRFQFENRINAHFLAHGLTIAVSPAPQVHDTRKYRKYPFLKGLFLDIKGGLEVMTSDGFPGIFRNLETFRRIRRLAYSRVRSRRRAR
jgi:polyisoprenyl-phosphate glycosyltransferase